MQRTALLADVHIRSIPDQHVNTGRVKRGQPLIRAIAVVPGDGDLGDAVGVELANRGFSVIPASTTMTMVIGVDFAAVYQAYSEPPRYAATIREIKTQLRARAIDAFLVVKSDRFAPRPFRQYPYFQLAQYSLYVTDDDSRSEPLQSGGWVNIADRPRRPSDAAVEIVGEMAMRVSNPL